MVAKACLMVRAQVNDPADRAAFDAWYAQDHLPAAVATFGADRGWRCWSRVDPAIHYAFYEFADVAQLHHVMRSAGLQVLIADFDARWSGRVTRTRDVLEIVGSVRE